MGGEVGRGLTRRGVMTVGDTQKVVKIPNTKTVETLNRSESGEDIYQARDANDLFDQLEI